MFNPDPVLVTLLQATVNSGASDLHLTVGRPPTARRDGTLVSFENVKVLDHTDTERMVMSLLDERQIEELARQPPGRLLVRHLRPRPLPCQCLQPAQLVGARAPRRALPCSLARGAGRAGARAQMLLNKPYGIVLVVGPTGSGKSTTLAAMIDRINETKPVHILTIEDPVEYLHHHKMAMVNQREVGTDAISFEQGLRSALREDPDVILLGEMRDLESIQIALSLAETGHLVFATLHTNDASQALDRMVDVFPAEKRDQIQTMLAGSLQGVISPAPASRDQRRTRRRVRGADRHRGGAQPGPRGQEPPAAQRRRHRRARRHADDRDGLRPARDVWPRHDGDGAVGARPTRPRSRRKSRRSLAGCRRRRRRPPARSATSGSGQRAGDDMPQPEPANVG